MKLLFFILLILLPLSSYAYDELCSTVQIHELKKLKLTTNEKRLLCGDPDDPAYRSIPIYQARYFLIGFYQSRGYLRPKLEMKKGILYARSGPRSTVEKIKVDSKRPELKNDVQTELRHLYKRKILSTGMLNSIESESRAQIRRRGYPCGKTSVLADVETDEVDVALKDLHLFRFGEVKKEKIEGLRDNALDRFYPFQHTDLFNEDLLRLTEKRMTRSGVVQGTYFLEKCEGDHFELSENFILGPPRTIKYGIGASTEQGPMVRLRWSNNRYKSMASQMVANVQASFRSQSLTLSADSFFWHGEPRRSLYTEADLMHERQVHYEQLVYNVKPLMKWTRDSEGFNKIYTLGPTYEGGTYHSQGNANTLSYGSGTAVGSLQWMSHEYELFDILPEEGQLYNLNFDFRHPAMGFQAPLLKLDSSITQVRRLSNWGRGTLIGAAKINLGTTSVNTNLIGLEALPPGVKFFGGGSDDIRGFYLRTLPKNNGVGALSRGSLKLELRRTHVYFQSVEAFTFFDAGRFGEKSWMFDSTVYYSPGIGIRWLSPLGMVQSYIARGMTAAPYKDDGNFYYVGIGGTF